MPQHPFTGAAMAVFVSACTQSPPPETVARPAMTNEEYEMVQLRALGAATDAQITNKTTGIRVPRDNTIPTETYRAQPDRMLAPPTRTLSSPTTVTPSTPAASRTGPVQKAGAIFIGPGGTSSRQVGAIMINSDGTTGQKIGNKIYSR